MWNIILIGCIDKGIDAVVHVFLDGIVHRTLTVRRPRAVVVHAQAAAAVHKIHVVTHLVQVDVVLGRLAQGRLYAAYLGDLAADVEVNEFQAVVHSHAVQLL